LRCLPSKPPLIEGRREWRLFFLGVLALFLLSLGWRYGEYRRFVGHKRLFVEADVLLHYTKTKGTRRYDVLKLQNGRLTFYTTTRRPLSNDLRGRRVRLVLFPSRLGFWDYLATPYLPSKVLRILPKRSVRMALYEKIARQHRHPWMREFYGALFLALPLSKALRERVTLLGVNHLLALSGFHMGVLWALIYGTLGLVYRPLQSRFFPWRSRLADVGSVTLVWLGVYVWLTGVPPSLLRAYTMVAIGWLALLWGVEIFSFSFLLLCVLLLTALFPGLLLSVGFWLSVTGVFLIYLFLQWSKGWPGWAVFVGLNLWIYVTMVPVVHTLFPTFTLYQTLSPLLSLLFIPFYPLSALLHIVGAGGWADGWLSALLRLPEGGRVTMTGVPVSFLGGYALLALAAIRYRLAFYALGLVALCVLLWLVEQVA